MMSLSEPSSRQWPAPPAEQVARGGETPRPAARAGWVDATAKDERGSHQARPGHLGGPLRMQWGLAAPCLGVVIHAQQLLLQWLHTAGKVALGGRSPRTDLRRSGVPLALAPPHVLQSMRLLLRPLAVGHWPQLAASTWRQLCAWLEERRALSVSAPQAPLPPSVVCWWRKKCALRSLWGG